MLNTEFVKNLHNNYERIMLEKKPEERRYQYCILSRGGIKGLLSCSLRYINGDAYLYYDITSKQNIMQLCKKRKLTREWVKDFFWNVQRVRMELERFLLGTDNIIWHPQHIYQDLENNIFAFLYMPYYEGDSGFADFLEFLVEKIDYEDSQLVDCVYKMYDKYENNGEVYLQAHIFEDIKMLDDWEEELSDDVESKIAEVIETRLGWNESERKQESEELLENNEKGVRFGKRKLFSFFENRREQRKQKNMLQKVNYDRELQISMESIAVAEEFKYEGTDYGQTVYIEEPIERKPITRKLYSEDGRVLARLEDAFVIGKIKEESDLVLEDVSVSRMHARIIKEGEEYFLEDCNSTNGTYKNGLRLNPYEKRQLQEEDEITIGAVTLTFR